MSSLLFVSPMPASHLASLILLTILALTLASAQASEAVDASPVGLWQTISDVDGKPHGLVRIAEKDGVYHGTIVGILVPGEDPSARCELCPDARRDQPIIGLVFLTGLKRLRQDEFDGGEILDPDTGSVYRCQARLTDGGRTLIVRGYIGFSLFGRSQTWRRSDQ
jgi:uncharacterized protein (DUF2147 family)